MFTGLPLPTLLLRALGVTIAGKSDFWDRPNVQASHATSAWRISECLIITQKHCNLWPVVWHLVMSFLWTYRKGARPSEWNDPRAWTSLGKTMPPWLGL